MEEQLGFETDNVKAINAKNDESLSQSVKAGKDFKDLSQEERGRLYELYEKNRGFFEYKDFEAGMQKEYEKMRQREAIATIQDPKDLTQEQRRLIADDLGAFQNAWAYFFNDEKDTLRDYQENYKAQNVILPQTQKALAFLDNIHSHKSISNTISSALKGEMDKERFEDCHDDVSTIATTAGFDEIGYNKKGELFFYKGEQAYKINQGFFDNFTNILEANMGSLGAGLAGASYGARVGTTPQTRAVLALGFGAIGSFVGGWADVAITNAYLNRENNFNELIAHATQEGALSLVGDVAALGIAKYGGKALSAMKSTEAWGKIIDYTPIVGFGKRALDGNASAAQELINKTYTKEQLGALQEAGNAFGAQLTLGNAKANAERITQAFGENSAMAKAYANITEALSLPSQRQRQQAFIQAIRADESGNLNAFLSEAAASSPKARENMRSILNLTTLRLTRELENLKLNKGDVKQIFDELESGTKSSYNEAMSEVLGKIYDESYKVNLNELKAGGSIKGDSFITHDPKLTPATSDLRTPISVDEWVKELAGLHPQKEIVADLQELYKKHSEIFAKPSEVFKLIQEIKTNPTYFYTNNQPNIALIGKMLENGKLGKLGIHKETNQVRHATQASKGIKEHERLVRRGGNNPPAEWANSTQPIQPTPNGEKSLLEDMSHSTTPTINKATDSAPKIFNMQDTTIEGFDDFARYADMLGIKFESNTQAKEAHKQILASIKEVEC